MNLVISAAGEVRCLYGEALDLSTLGPLQIQRASHVDADGAGQWWADMAPSSGPKLGPFAARSQALAAEGRWLNQHMFHVG